MKRHAVGLLPKQVLIDAVSLCFHHSPGKKETDVH